MLLSGWTEIKNPGQKLIKREKHSRKHIIKERQMKVVPQ